MGQGDSRSRARAENAAVVRRSELRALCQRSFAVEAEIDTLVRMGGCGRAPRAILKTAHRRGAWPAGWNIGTPDAVVEMPKAFPIPARGAIEYQYVILPTRFTKDMWVQNVEVRPSDRAHGASCRGLYSRAGIEMAGRRAARNDVFACPSRRSFTTSDILMVYTPGNSFDGWTPGMAKKIKAGSDLVLQMHYTANGKAGARSHSHRRCVCKRAAAKGRADAANGQRQIRHSARRSQLSRSGVRHACPTMRCSSAYFRTCICGARLSST